MTNEYDKALEALDSFLSSVDHWGWDEELETIRTVLQHAEKVNGLVKALEYYAAERDNILDFAGTPALKGTSMAHQALRAFKGE